MEVQAKISMLVRPSTSSDFAAIAAVYAASYAHFCPASYPKEILLEALPLISTPQPKLIEDAGFRVVENDKGEVVAAGGWTAGIPGASSKCHIRHLACRPDESGKGVGRLLVETLKKDAAQHGFSEMEAFSTKNAAPFYEKLGFTVIDPDFVVDLKKGTGRSLPFSTVWMRASLTS